MRKRIVHVLLALLLLMQSVSTLAAVSSLVTSPVEPHELVQDHFAASVQPHSPPAEMAPCHGNGELPNLESVENCCESMEDSGCILGCAFLAAAVPGDSALARADIHEHYPVDAGYAAPQKPLYGLFRPPITA